MHCANGLIPWRGSDDGRRQVSAISPLMNHKKSGLKKARFFVYSSLLHRYLNKLFLMSLRPSRVLSQVFSTLAYTSSQRA